MIFLSNFVFTSFVVNLIKNLLHLCHYGNYKILSFGNTGKKWAKNIKKCEANSAKYLCFEKSCLLKESKQTNMKKSKLDIVFECSFKSNASFQLRIACFEMPESSSFGRFSTSQHGICCKSYGSTQKGNVCSALASG